MKNASIRIRQKSSIGYVVLFFIISIVSPPFLRLPFDPWLHLIMIRRCFTTGTIASWDTFAGHANSYPQFWHYIWAQIFKILMIDDAIIWATIIHQTQAFLALCLIFFGSKLIISRLLPNDFLHYSSHLAGLSALLWLFGNGTSSLGVQQSWLSWYGITPQGVCLPLFWYAYFLSLTFINTDSSIRFCWQKVLVIILISVFILLAHPLELAYLMINGLLLSFFLIRNRWLHLLLILASIAAAVLVRLTIKGAPPLTEIFTTDSTFYHLAIGVVSINRFSSAFNSISLFSIFSFCVFLFFHVLMRNRSAISREQSSLIFSLVISSIIFILIPTFWPLAGLVGQLASPDLVWRFFFAIPWFLGLPIIICQFLGRKELLFHRIPIMALFGLLVVLYFGASTRILSWQNLNTVLNFCSVGFCNRDNIKLQYSSVELNKHKANIDSSIKRYFEHGLEQNSRPVVLDIEGELGYVAAALWGYQVLQVKYVPLTDQEKARYESDFHIVKIRNSQTFDR